MPTAVDARVKTIDRRDKVVKDVQKTDLLEILPPAGPWVKQKQLG